MAIEDVNRFGLLRNNHMTRACFQNSFSAPPFNKFYSLGVATTGTSYFLLRQQLPSCPLASYPGSLGAAQRAWVPVRGYLLGSKEGG